MRVVATIASSACDTSFMTSALMTMMSAVPLHA